MRQLLNRTCTGVFQSDYRRLINSGNGKLRRHTEISGDYSIIIAFSLKNEQNYANVGNFRQHINCTFPEFSRRPKALWQAPVQSGS